MAKRIFSPSSQWPTTRGAKKGIGESIERDCNWDVVFFQRVGSRNTLLRLPLLRELCHVWLQRRQLPLHLKRRYFPEGRISWYLQYSFRQFSFPPRFYTVIERVNYLLCYQTNKILKKIFKIREPEKLKTLTENKDPAGFIRKTAIFGEWGKCSITRGGGEQVQEQSSSNKSWKSMIWGEPHPSILSMSSSLRNSCKTLKCPQCNWHYKYQETLDIHMKEKHSETEVTHCSHSSIHTSIHSLFCLFISFPHTTMYWSYLYIHSFIHCLFSCTSILIDHVKLLVNIICTYVC